MRLDRLPTLRINPSETCTLYYNGKTSQGVGGDTVATALYANGVRVFGRSLKYHRPRGLYSLDGECSNTCMAVDGIPNVRAENTPAKNGMHVDAQNVKGSADFDWMGFMDKLDWLMPAGFYYRTLHKPAWLWPFALKQVRNVAGLGKISPDFKMKGRYAEIYPTADVCVIGGGAAGMSAALAAAEGGLRVILLEARPWLGGSFDYRVSPYDGEKALYQRARELADQVEAAANIRVFTHAANVGLYNNNLVTAFQVGPADGAFDERYIEIRAVSVVVATGCIERPLLFENNERPGVMQIGCAHRLARTYGLLPGNRAVFSIGHDLGLEAAVDLCDLGMEIACVADIREDGQRPDLLLALAERKIPFLRGWVAVKAHGAKQVKKVTLRTIEGSVKRQLECDLLVASAGLTPLTGPLTLAQARLRFDTHTGYFLPADLPAKMHAAGSLTGRNHPLAIEASGRLAGLKAAADCGVNTAEAVAAAAPAQPASRPRAGQTRDRTGQGQGFICFDEDTTVRTSNGHRHGLRCPRADQTLHLGRHRPGPGRHSRPQPAPVRRPVPGTGRRNPGSHNVAGAPGADVARHLCRGPSRHVQAHAARRAAEARRRGVPPHRRVAAGALLLAGLQLPRRGPQRAQQRGHAGRLHPGQVPPPRARRPQGAAARLCRQHGQDDAR
jgi:sarcosine oxidase subunit alpha